MNRQRVELRRSRPMVLAMQSGFGGELPVEYFQAMSESEEEGIAAFELYKVRRSAAAENQSKSWEQE